MAFIVPEGKTVFFNGKKIGTSINTEQGEILLIGGAGTPLKSILPDLTMALEIPVVNMMTPEEKQSKLALEQLGQQLQEKKSQAIPPTPKPKVRALSIPKLGRNDPCHCGSGKKFKKCCMFQKEDTNVDPPPK